LDPLMAKGVPAIYDFYHFVLQQKAFAEVSPAIASVMEPVSTFLGPQIAAYEVVRLDQPDSLGTLYQSLLRDGMEMPEERFEAELPTLLVASTHHLLEQMVQADRTLLGDAAPAGRSKLARVLQSTVAKSKSVPAIAATPTPAWGQLQVATMLKEPPEVVRRFAEYYVGAGVGQVNIYFDQEDDPAMEAVRHMPQVRVRTSTVAARGGKRRMAVEARQSDCYTHAYRKMKSGWLIVCDADEFCHGAPSLPALLQSCPKTQRVLRFHSSEAVWSEGSDISKPYSADYVRLPIWDDHWAVVSTGLSPEVNAMFRRGLLSHRSGKYAVRAGHKVERLGIHKVFFADGDQALQVDPSLPSGLCVHFDAISYKHWRAKVANRLRKGHGFVGFDIARKTQLQTLSALDESQIEGVFRQLYGVSQDMREVLAASESLRKLQIFEKLNLSCTPEDQAGDLPVDNPMTES
ncbi:MAG: glycosyltransferase family 2 protein, partial [Pseudomonadota bacterium]